MEAIRLPNGNLLAPYRAETGPAIGDAMLEIGPDHPDFASWSRHVAELEPAVAAPAAGLETVAEARANLGKRRIGILRKDGEAAPVAAPGAAADASGFTSSELSGVYLVGASGSAVAGDGAEAKNP